MAEKVKKTIKKSGTKTKTAKKSAVKKVSKKSGTKKTAAKKTGTKKPSTKRKRVATLPLGRPPKIKDDFSLDYRITYKAETHLWETLEKWTDIYKRIKGIYTSPSLLAKKFTFEMVKRLDVMLAKGEIDPNDPDCRLP